MGATPDESAEIRARKTPVRNPECGLHLSQRHPMVCVVLPLTTTGFFFFFRHAMFQRLVEAMSSRFLFGPIFIGLCPGPDILTSDFVQDDMG